MLGANYIGGSWRRGKHSFPSTSPEHGRELGEATQSSSEEVEEAVVAARNALLAWRSTPVAERSNHVAAAAEILRQEYGNAGEATPLKRLICDEMGKRLPEADIEVVESADMLSFFAGCGPEYLRERNLDLDPALWPSKRSSIDFESIGVVGIIKPWNYPLEIPIWAIGAALVAGNTAVFKPSELTPLVGTRIVEIFESAGLPPGVLNLVTGNGRTGQSIVRNPGVDMISFTGSIPVGRSVAVECAQRFCRVSLELGGKDAMLVLDDANPELAVNGALWGAFANCGQVCVGVRRLFLHRSLRDSVLSSLIEQAQGLRLGRDLGPLASTDQLEKVKRHVDDARKGGATVLCGGRRATEPELATGYYYEPTVLEGTTPTMLVEQEDTFGPVVSVYEFTDEEEVLSRINGVHYDLGASVWTEDRERGLRIARRISSGMVWINDVNVAFPQAPWSGRRWSGHGVDLSEFSLYEFSHIKHLNYETGTDERRPWWFPYA